MSVALDLSEFVPGGTVGAWYMGDDDYNTDYVHTAHLLENPENIWGIAAQVNLTDEVELWGNYWHAEGGFGTAGQFTGSIIDEGHVDQWAIGVNWFPAATPGFHFKGVYFNGEVENSTSNTLAGLVGTTGGVIDADYDGFELTFRRDF